MYKRVYVWEWPVRLTHWLNVICIIILSFTGFYIGWPFIAPPLTDEFPIMAIMRYIHFVAAYVFAMSFIIRIYWTFAGNKYANLAEFIPFSKKVWKEMLGDIKFYLFLKKEHPHRPGHHTLAGVSYVALFLLFCLEIITGFVLYSQSHHGFVATLMGGWILGYVSVQFIRLIHHLSMWLMIIFAMVHIYIGWYNDIVDRNSIISSIFSGYKTLDID